MPLVNVQDIALPPGANYRVAQPMVRLTVESAGAAEIELVATLGAPKGETAPPVAMATTVAIHMDKAVAADLLEQLRKAIGRAGPGAERPA